MAVRNWILGFVGIVFALWMGAGRWAFGAGGELTWWYVPLIALPFALLQLFTVRRIRVAEHRGRRVGRAVYVALALSWLCALGFGLTVPDRVGGELTSVLSLLAGEEWLDMAIALCNPFGIIALTTAVAALIFAIAAGRDPRPTEDELLDAAGVDAPTMVPHPLDR